MIKVTDQVSQILLADDIARECLKLGFLNMSAYAASIQDEVEQATKKEVSVNTIVVALSRIRESLPDELAYRPRIILNTLNITSPLTELTYEKTQTTSQQLESVVKSVGNQDKFLTVTGGVGEITVVCSDTLARKISKAVEQEPKVVMDSLVAVSVSFSDKYIPIPNTIYSLISSLAAKRINVFEIVSTYTELTFIVNQKDLDTTISCLKPHLS